MEKKQTKTTKKVVSKKTKEKETKSKESKTKKIKQTKTEKENTNLVKTDSSSIKVNTNPKNKEEINKKVFSMAKGLDQNGDGKVNLKDFVILGLKVPGVHINRREFLKSVLKKKCDDKVVDLAIEYNPKYAKIDSYVIESLADDVIMFEKKCATATSTALGIPGGVAIPLTLTADISQYFAFLLRAAQKLMYLYGYPEIKFEEGKKIDEKTLSILEIAIGVMFGVQGADTAIRGLSKGIVDSIKTGIKITWSINPLKTVGSLVGVGAGKLGFGLLGKAIPIIGGVISGGLTYVTFAPTCEKLRKELRSNPLNDINNYK